MLRTVYYPVFKIRQLPQALGLSLGALLGLLLAVFVVGQRADQQTAQIFQEYGQALANLTSSRAVDSAINNDLVGLHALLQDLVAQPRVLFASVHDVDHRLLVQAGEPYWETPVGEFGAVISMQGDYGGRISVVLAQEFEGEVAVKWAIVGVATLLFLMVVLSLYDAYGVGWELKRRDLGRAKQSIDSDQPPNRWDEGDTKGSPIATSDASDEGTEEARAVSYLYVRSVNGSALQQQLSVELFGSILNDFNAVLSRVLTLYGGENISGDVVKGLRLGFYANDNIVEAQFQSLCAAFLLQSLMDKNKFRFKLSSLATAEDEADPMSDEGVFCVLDDAKSLMARVDVQPFAEKKWRVLGLKESFAYLVEHQKLRLSEVVPD